MSLAPLLADHTESAAEEIMRGAIDLASRSSGDEAGVVLSLGPYGATLSPSQEYAGIYPPPYGPSLPTSSTEPPTNAFSQTSAGRADAIRAENALADWHLDRLRIYAAQEAAWRKVEWVGFETVPLLREVRAIRSAMGRLNDELGKKWGGGRTESEAHEEGREWWRKKFWISSAYPDGHHPQHLSSDSTSIHVSIDDVLKTLLDSPDSVNNSPRPDGVGINCTHPSHISNLTGALTTSMQHRLITPSGGSALGSETGPLFVLYPDGGAVYDTTTRTWTERTTRPDEWAVGVAALARRIERAEWKSEGAKHSGRVWGGVIVGGCCKAGFEEIRWLRKELDKSE